MKKNISTGILFLTLFSPILIKAENLSIRTPNILCSSLLDSLYYDGEIKNSVSQTDHLVPEFLGGALGGTLGSLAGIGITTAVLYMMGGIWIDCIDYTHLGGIIIGTPTGVAFGIPAGITITGNMLNHKSNYWKSFLGTIIGMGISALIFQDNILSPASITCISACGILGGVIGYNK